MNGGWVTELSPKILKQEEKQTKRLTAIAAEKLAQITDHFAIDNPFGWLSKEKKGGESFYLLNDQWGEATR